MTSATLPVQTLAASADAAAGTADQGTLAGLFTALLQTKLRIEPILAGILVAAGLYTVNYAVLGGQSNLYLQYETVNSAGATVNEASPTIYKNFAALFAGTDSALLDTNAQVLIHQPMGGTGDGHTQQTDIQIVADETRWIRQHLNELLAEATGQPIERINADTERDNYMRADEACAYGLVDKVISSRNDGQER